MNKSYIIPLIVLIAIIAMATGCEKIAQIKGSVAGTVYRDGRPLFGQVQILDPKTRRSIRTEPVNNQGHFIIRDVPPGEWLLAFLGPSSMPLGNYKYIKVQPGRPLTNIDFEVTEEDPLAVELLEKVSGQSNDSSR